MLKIIKKITRDINDLDYVLENNIELYANNWNGDKYTEGWYYNTEIDADETTGHSYIPVYRWQVENIDVSKLEENTKEWQQAVEILGFEEL